MKIRYSKDEKLRKAAAESVLADKAATPTDRMAAVRCLERLENAARRRAEDREWNLPEPAPAPPAEPTIDDLVRDLESAPKGPPECPANAIGSDSSPERPPDAATVPPELPKRTELSEVTEVTVSNPPSPEYEGRCPSYNLVLCGCSRGDIAPPTAWCGDPNVAGHSIEAVHGNPFDLAKSVDIWRQQLQDEQDERRRLIAAVEREQSKNRF